MKQAGLPGVRKLCNFTRRIKSMKIFLNDRTIEFITDPQEDQQPADLLIEFRSGEDLKAAWEDFKRHEKFRRLRIIDPGTGTSNDLQTSSAFKTFASYFKMVQAAGGLVKNENSEILFIHRLGYWDLPKGKIDRKGKESAASAAIREVKEETGLTNVLVLRELPATWHIYMIEDKWILKKTNWFEMVTDSSQPLKPQTSEGIFLVKWTPPKDIHCILSHTYASIRELLVNTLL